MNIHEHTELLDIVFIRLWKRSSNLTRGQMSWIHLPIEFVDSPLEGAMAFISEQIYE
jgi:hypothetical protein